MARAKISEPDWQTFMSVAEQLQIPVRELLDENVRFSAIEAAGHSLGRAVALNTTERLALARAGRMTGSPRERGLLARTRGRIFGRQPTPCSGTRNFPTTIPAPSFKPTFHTS